MDSLRYHTAGDAVTPLFATLPTRPTMKKLHFENGEVRDADRDDEEDDDE